jgi:hypothetical protein
MQARIGRWGVIGALILGASDLRGAETAQEQPEDAFEARGEVAEEPRPAEAPYSVGAYVEAFYQWNFNRPANGITDQRGFDNRHNAFTLSNVAIGADWDDGALLGRLTLQAGHTPATYYSAEPRLPGGAGSNDSNAELWRHVQEAFAGYRFGPDDRVEIAAGLFLSPIGPESLAVHESWNWSRSNLFFGLPFYHTGIRASVALTPAWRFTLAGYNGWNSVVDDNDEKSVAPQLTYEDDDLAFSLLYFGGVERPRGAPEGRAWRHLYDAHVTWQAAPFVAFIAHGNLGHERGHFGTSRWLAGALSARFRLAPVLFWSLRGDGFSEHIAQSARGSAAPIFWPVPWVSSATTTVDLRPHERLSLRLELRRDQAGGPLFFDASSEGPLALPNRRTQTTITAGATSWF